MRQLAELGVVTVSNLMLVHPDSTPETLEAGIDFLARLPAGSFEATRMMAYHGTRLQERLRREGRLIGNPLRWGYRIDDPVVERFARLFARLRTEAFLDYSIGYRTTPTWRSRFTGSSTVDRVGRGAGQRFAPPSTPCTWRDTVRR